MFAREFGFRPKLSADLEYWEERSLIEGLVWEGVMEIRNGESVRSSAWSSVEATEDHHDPRFPRASRGDVMASPEELMALGIQYSRE